MNNTNKIVNMEKWSEFNTTNETENNCLNIDHLSKFQWKELQRSKVSEGVMKAAKE